MASISVYYEYDLTQNKEAPIWYVLKLGSIMNWSKNSLYIPIEAPFKKLEAHEFENIAGISIEQADLTISSDKPGSFGIKIPMVKNRAEKLGFDVDDIKQFIIQVGDIEEILQMQLFR